LPSSKAGFNPNPHVFGASGWPDLNLCQFARDGIRLTAPVTDSDGFPAQQRGVTAYPGLYFVGLPWLHTQKSGLLLGVGEDAASVAERITRVSD
jgi:hypothetical protein